MELDKIDQIAAKAFEGFIVKKDLLEQFRKTYPVPTYVIEFLLGRYCATTDEEDIQEGLEIVKRQLQDRTVRPGEEEYFKSRAREKGSIKLIDLITAKLDTATDSYVATLPSLMLNKVRISADIVNDNDRMLTGGFYAEIEMEYDAAIAQENSGRPFGIANIRPIQLSQRNVLEIFYKGRENFTLGEWKDFLIRSVGMEPGELTEKAKNVL
ncbi:MAG: anti-phage BREX system Lon protease BrxL, partial [Bacteroidales bacterium]